MFPLVGVCYCHLMCKDSVMESHRFTCSMCPLSYQHKRGLRAHYLITHQMGYLRHGGPFVYSSVDELESRRQAAICARVNPPAPSSTCHCCAHYDAADAFTAETSSTTDQAVNTVQVACRHVGMTVRPGPLGGYLNMAPGFGLEDVIRATRDMPGKHPAVIIERLLFGSRPASVSQQNTMEALILVIYWLIMRILINISECKSILIISRCPECPKEFTQRSNLNRHRGTIHGKEVG